MNQRVMIDLGMDIPLPATTVYAFLADIQNAEPIPRSAAVKMVKTPPGPTRVGTQWHESVRFAPGLWMHVLSAVTEAAEPHVLAMRFTSMWWSGELRYEITDSPTGCRLHHHETLTPRAPLRPFSRWIQSSLERKIEERLRDIRDVAVLANGRG
ncbi:hypothetical protein HFP15_39015 [Amycolatopsis sp. K13G38]|uniref:SRPBCC family protein n=1 Tax=Amycolatopsis acididurans TaxID=2724524 RepID=A0ABX1JGR0_9PSEU|nr:SRPBCC family protein [Amycolatopsis acididurans]NKQ58851.1 hypothetical protein [Amycolatopsis acididurans]